MIVDKMDANYFNSMLDLFEKAWLDIERLINKDSLPRYRSTFCFALFFFLLFPFFAGVTLCMCLVFLFLSFFLF